MKRPTIAWIAAALAIATASAAVAQPAPKIINIPPENGAATSKQPTDPVSAAVQAIEQTTDPSATVQVYAAAMASNPDSVPIQKAYVRRMVDFGLPYLANVQARQVLRQDPKDALAWATTAFVDAQNGLTNDAFADITEAARLSPDEPFVQYTAAQILAYNDVNPPQTPVPDALQRAVAEMRKNLADKEPFKSAYESARKVNQEAAAAAATRPVNQPESAAPAVIPAIPSNVNAQAQPESPPVYVTPPSAEYVPPMSNTYNYYSYYSSDYPYGTGYTSAYPYYGYYYDPYGYYSPYSTTFYGWPYTGIYFNIISGPFLHHHRFDFDRDRDHRHHQIIVNPRPWIHQPHRERSDFAYPGIPTPRPPRIVRPQPIVPNPMPRLPQRQSPPGFINSPTQTTPVQPPIHPGIIRQAPQGPQPRPLYPQARPQERPRLRDPQPQPTQPPTLVPALPPRLVIPSTPAEQPTPRPGARQREEPARGRSAAPGRGGASIDRPGRNDPPPPSDPPARARPDPARGNANRVERNNPALGAARGPAESPQPAREAPPRMAPSRSPQRDPAASPPTMAPGREAESPAGPAGPTPARRAR